jgi:hypothetical protein
LHAEPKCSYDFLTIISILKQGGTLINAYLGATTIIRPVSTSVTQVDGATSSHPQKMDTTQQVATTKDSTSDSNYQMTLSTDGGSINKTHNIETRNNSVTAIILSLIFILVSFFSILAVVLIIIVKLSRKTNCKPRSSESDGSASVDRQLLLVESDGLQEDDVKF